MRRSNRQCRFRHPQRCSSLGRGIGRCPKLRFHLQSAGSYQSRSVRVEYGSYRMPSPLRRDIAHARLRPPSRFDASDGQQRRRPRPAQSPCMRRAASSIQPKLPQTPLRYSDCLGQAPVDLSAGATQLYLSARAFDLAANVNPKKWRCRRLAPPASPFGISHKPFWLELSSSRSDEPGLEPSNHRPDSPVFPSDRNGHPAHC